MKYTVVFVMILTGPLMLILLQLPSEVVVVLNRSPKCFAVLKEVENCPDSYDKCPSALEVNTIKRACNFQLVR